MDIQKMHQSASVIVENQAQEDMMMSSFGVTTSVNTNNFFFRQSKHNESLIASGGETLKESGYHQMSQGQEVARKRSTSRGKEERLQRGTKASNAKR